MTDLKIVCVGAGYFSKYHIDSWQRLDRVQLVGVCDLDKDRAAATSVPAFDDLDQMLKATCPDIVDIILPPQAHGKTIMKALSFAPAAIICQKPFCRSIAEARVVTSQAEAAGVPLIIHENFRFQPWFRAIKAAIDAGRIGSVRQVTFRLRPGDGQGAHAYLDRQPYFQQMPRFLVHETGVHYLDTFRYLLGPPTHVYADLRRENPVLAGEDAGYILMDHGGGVRSLLDGNRVLDHAATNTRRTMGEGLVEGTEGTLTLTGDGAVQLRRFGERKEESLLPPDLSDRFGGDCAHALQSHVVAGLCDNAPIENLARDYMAVREVEEAVYRAAETGRKVTL